MKHKIKIILLIILTVVISAIIVRSAINIWKDQVVIRGLSIDIEETEESIIFTLNTKKEINIPQAGLHKVSYPSGPWSIYYFNPEEEKWERVGISGRCLSPWCSDFKESCNPPIVLCDIIPHLPSCIIVSKNHLFKWDKKEVINKKIYCDDLEKFCYERSPVKPGEYKIVFSYKANKCPNVKWYSENIAAFKNNIKTFEKNFFIE